MTSTPSRVSDASHAAAHVVRRAVDAERLAVLGALLAELGRQDDLIAPIADRRTHQPLVGERPVHVGRVDQRDPEIDRPVDGRGRFRIVFRGSRTPTSPCSRDQAPRRPDLRTKLS